MVRGPSARRRLHTPRSAVRLRDARAPPNPLGGSSRSLLLLPGCSPGASAVTSGGTAARPPQRSPTPPRGTQWLRGRLSGPGSSQPTWVTVRPPEPATAAPGRLPSPTDPGSRPAPTPSRGADELDTLGPGGLDALLLPGHTLFSPSGF